jgi:hypothetical protein
VLVDVVGEVVALLAEDAYRMAVRRMRERGDIVEEVVAAELVVVCFVE